MLDVTRSRSSLMPCYASYAGFYRLMTFFKEHGIPRRVETRRMPDYLKNDGSRLVAGLFAMGLLNEDGFAKDGLRKLVASFGTTAWAKTVSDTLPSAYPFVPQKLEDMSSARLKEAFVAHVGRDFASMRNAEAFFLGLAADAKLEMSPSLAARAERAVGEAKKWIRLRGFHDSKTSENDDGEEVNQEPPESDGKEPERADSPPCGDQVLKERISTTKLGERLVVLADMLRDLDATTQERDAVILLIQTTARKMNAA